MTQEILQAVLAESANCSVHVIGRHQAIREVAVIINNGSVERIVNEESEGLGVQVFTSEGYSGFASSDNPSPATAGQQVDQALQMALLSKQYGGESNQAIFTAPQINLNISPPHRYPFEHLPLPEVRQLVLRENKNLLNQFPGIAVQTVYRQIEERWHIVRTGGTSACFTIPRAVVSHTLTARASGKSVTTRSAMAGTDVGILLDQKVLVESNTRAGVMAQLATDLLAAPPVKSGHYKLLIDYALAKGLAHEAFGHAVESDAVKTSILGKDGKLAIGMEVADSKVSIIDGPVPGDWAYQPISANALPRQTVTIVEKGKLAAGLGDLFSASQAGIPVSGAGRAESYGQIPLPRMSNIRIQVEDPVPLTKPWPQVTPKELYQVLLENNLLKPEEEVYYLVGYKGGQVNTQYGDFVFNCSAIYRLAEEPELFRPGIFAGKTLSALKSIKAGIGDMICDALGTCGKWGQGVPSSGGSHAFLLLEESPDITIGGE